MRILGPSLERRIIRDRNYSNDSLRYSVAICAKKEAKKLTLPPLRRLDVLPMSRKTTNLASQNEKVEELRTWLISHSLQKRMVLKSEVMRRFSIPEKTFWATLESLSVSCVFRLEPDLAALILEEFSLPKRGGALGPSLKVGDDEEAQRCFDYWEKQGRLEVLEIVDKEEEEESVAADLLQRFSLTQIRMQQRAFRDAVFRACGGRCVISGCAVPEALEAAHIHGRNWRHGHNTAEDGILLRRDLHALYDAGLLQVDSIGRISFSASIDDEYEVFAGYTIKG